MIEKLSLTIGYERLDRENLSPEELVDLAVADRARESGYAPYSKYLIGVALRTNDDRVFAGWNMEGIDYHALHAERNATGKMDSASRHTGIKRVTVVGALDGAESEDPVYPCGSCRQQLLEFARGIDAESNPTVIAAGIRGKVIRIALKDLLPFAFFPEEIKK